MKSLLIMVILTGCSPLSVDEQNKQIVEHAKVCVDAGMDVYIGTNGLTGERDAYCVKGDK